MSDFEPHDCDFCSGTVRPVVARGETIRIRDKIVLVEGGVIGKCDHCGHRYWPAAVLKRAELAVQHPENAARLASIPVIAA